MRTKLSVRAENFQPQQLARRIIRPLLTATFGLAITFTLSCTSEQEEQLKNLGSSGENSSSSLEQSSSSVASQSSSSGIPDICCPPASCYEHPEQLCPPVCAPPILIGGQYGCGDPNLCCPPGPATCYDKCPDGPPGCAPPILVGYQFVCANPNQSSSSSAEKCNDCAPPLSKCGEKEYNPQTHFCDSRDGKVYKFMATTSGQIWMAENLNFNHSNSECYNPSPNSDWIYNCDTYEGAYRLYDKIPTKCCDAIECYCEVCPVGWHIPSDEEWESLSNSIGSDFDFAMQNNFTPSAAQPRGWWSGSGPEAINCLLNADGTPYNCLGVLTYSIWKVHPPMNCAQPPETRITNCASLLPEKLFWKSTAPGEQKNAVRCVKNPLQIKITDPIQKPIDPIPIR